MSDVLIASRLLLCISDPIIAIGFVLFQRWLRRMIDLGAHKVRMTDFGARKVRTIVFAAYKLRMIVFGADKVRMIDLRAHKIRMIVFGAHKVRMIDLGAHKVLCAVSSRGEKAFKGCKAFWRQTVLLLEYIEELEQFADLWTDRLVRLRCHQTISVRSADLRHAEKTHRA